MKVKGFEKLIILHLGDMIEAANKGETQIKTFHRDLLTMDGMTDETLHAFASEKVSPLLAEHEVEDPSGYKTMGFAPYAEETGGKFALAIPGTKAIVLQAEKRERVLPGISVRNAVAERMKAHTAKEIEGWKPTRKDWAEMKDEVEAEMLKTAPIRPSRTNVIIHAPYVYVFASSAKTAEDVSACIRTAFGTWPVTHALTVDYALRQVMANVVRGNVRNVYGTDFIHVKHDDGEDVKLKDMDIQEEEVVLDYLTRHFTVRAMDMKIDGALTRQGIGDLHFRLADKAIITGLHIGEADVDANYDDVLDRYHNDSAAFLTYMANLFQLVLSLNDMMDVFRNDLCITTEFNPYLVDDDEV